MAIPAKKSAPRPARKRALAQAAQADPPAKSTRFGVLIKIGDKTVPVSGELLSQAKTSGVNMELQEPLQLGSLGDLEKAVGLNSGTFSSSFASLPKVLADPLSKFTDTLEQMVWTVEKAHLKVPGEGDTSGVKYTLEVNGEFTPSFKILDILEIVGVVFGATNEAVASPSKSG